MVNIYVAPEAFAKDETGQVAKGKGSKSVESLIGNWYSSAGAATFSADGTLISNGQNYKYTANDNVILLVGGNGLVTIPYKVSSNKLTVNLNGEVTVYSRKPVPPGNNIRSNSNHAGGISNELLLSSAWCSSFYNAKTGYSSSTRVQLRTDGTYSSGGQSEGYSSGSAGTYASQENTKSGGRWKVIDGELFMSKGSDKLTRIQTRIEQNNKGYIFLVVAGVEYAQCK